MAARKATSSPVRVSKHNGLWYFEVVAYEVDGKHYCGVTGMGRTYKDAKANFWQQWKERWPGVWLEPRLSR